MSATIRRIQAAVATFYSVRLEEMISQRRPRTIVRPRQLAMYLAREMTPCSFPQIGKAFGGRDHTTVMHAVSKIQELIDRHPGISSEIDEVRRTIPVGSTVDKWPVPSSAVQTGEA